MPPVIEQINVMPQAAGPDGVETCGYHTFKNGLLSLLYLQDKITLDQLRAYANNPLLFQHMYAKIRMIQNAEGNVDFTLPRLLHHLHLTKLGRYDFFEPIRGTSPSAPKTSDLMSLHLDRDGEQGISVVNLILAPNAPDIGLYGMEEDLFSAAALVKLARTPGEAKHVFAIGMGDEGHWVTVAMSQCASGQRQWLFMDSNYNSSRFKSTAVAKIETVLNKSPVELKRYLLEVYANASLTFQTQYELHFYPNTGEARLYGLHGQNAKQYYIDNEDNLEAQAQWIENRMMFMRICGWLTSPGLEEQANIKQLYWLSQYILNHIEENASPAKLVAKTTLQPLCQELEIALPSLLASPPYDEQEPLVETERLEEGTSPDEYDMETIAALQAVDQKPKSTEGFMFKLVSAIRWLIKTVRESLVHIAKSIGLVY